MKNQYEIDYQQGYDNANEEWLDRMDKIRAEVEQLPVTDTAVRLVTEILEKYKGESEE